MEAVEEPPLVTDVADSGKLNNASDKVENNVDASTGVDVCLKTNGDAEPIQDIVDSHQLSSTESSVKESGENVPASEATEDKPSDSVDIVTGIAEEEIVEIPSVLKDEKDPSVLNITETSENEVTVTVENVVVSNESVIEETVVELDGIIENTEENVTFETEILVESNVMDIEKHLEANNDETNNALLNDLGQNIDLSEVLRSSDVTNNVENNNCEQEVFNKEELLDILEGNDNEQVESRKLISDNFPEDSKKLEEQLALQQLSRLQTKKFKSKKSNEKKTPKKRLSRNDNVDGAKKEASKKDSSKQENDKVTENKSKEEISNEVQPKVEVPKEDSIVNELVKDWEDDDHVENEDVRKLRKSTEKATKSQEANVSQPELEQSQKDVSVLDEGSTPKTGDESQPHRRLGRVIKKKVIFDPDNPDTFTKTKTIKKEVTSEKDPSPPKKSKSDQASLRAKSKSPVNKLQWKKPNPKNSKQSYKRLTEIDKLLMDEGAVNMICQLTTEAPKGKMNMKSKAEFIKKIQSNTPDSKEKKFRERKKEIKIEDGEPKKIIGGKNRLSLSSSVKSPSVSEDFEAHSADDSIIYRRHSSSSYSSSCMSPRRLSDVENNIKEPGAQTGTPNLAQNESILSNDTTAASETFLTDTTSPPPKEIMNKRDCLSIKEKLNSKLSQVLNKRKRESVKTEKPSKIKKVSTDTLLNVVNNKLFQVNFKDNVAELCIRKSAGSLFTLQMLQEVNNLLTHINSMPNINVTLILTEVAPPLIGLDLKSLLTTEGPYSTQYDYAKEMAEAVKCLQTTLTQHGKLTCMGVKWECTGLSLALATLCDVVIASEGASFSMLEMVKVLLQPGTAALRESALPRNLVNDMIIFGKKLSASEALNSGLVSRVIWPERFVEQVRAIAKDIAKQPAGNLHLKKQLLSLNRNTESLLASFEKEKNLLEKYWTSEEGLQNITSYYYLFNE